MVKRRNPREEEETENRPLITTKVVEYLEPVMSRDLLCKFPDNSALGFDYSQSSLWSPLLPRNYSRALDDLDSASRRHLSLELGEEKNAEMELMKNKFLGFDISALKMKRRRKKKKTDPGFSADPTRFGCFVIGTKGWNGVLNAASKHFKKKTTVMMMIMKKKKKKRESIGDVKLLNYFKR